MRKGYCGMGHLGQRFMVNLQGTSDHNTWMASPRFIALYMGDDHVYNEPCEAALRIHCHTATLYHEQYPQ